MEKVNVGQLSSLEVEVLMGNLRNLTEVFAVNPGTVAACKARPMSPQRKDP